MDEVCFADSPRDVERCFPVVRQLRPQYDLAGFIEQVARQQKAGYRMVFIENDGAVVSVAGFRLGECLAWGRFLYVDDLITTEHARGRGYAGKLMDWLVEFAQSCNCDEFHLDSGVQRFGAHRFYLGKRMDITSHHFAIKLRNRTE